MILRLPNLKTLVTPIILASIAIPVALVLLGFLIAISLSDNLQRQVISEPTLLVSGMITIVVIIIIIAALSAFLGNEILESRKQSRFIDSVTHELKSPLASLKLLIQTLSRDIPEAQKSRLYQMMSDDVDRLSFFIDDVLIASQLEEGVPVQLAEDCNCSDIIEDVIQRCIARHKRESIQILRKLDNSLVLRVHKISLEIIFRNLIDNAIKYSSSDAHIAIELQQKPSGEVLFFIQDDGIGITRLQQRKIFSRFYRVNETEVKKRRGSGLGLYVVQQLILNMRGEIQVHSAGINKGSQFTVLLPRDMVISKVE
jgi:signal transduction histidine kinase